MLELMLRNISPVASFLSTAQGNSQKQGTQGLPSSWQLNLLPELATLASSAQHPILTSDYSPLYLFSNFSQKGFGVGGEFYNYLNN